MAARYKGAVRVAPPKSRARVVAFVSAQPLERFYVSVVIFAEIRFGIERLPDPLRRAGFNAWLTHEVRPMFEQRVLPVSEDVMFAWRLMVEEGRKSGHTFSQPDEGRAEEEGKPGREKDVARVRPVVALPPL